MEFYSQQGEDFFIYNFLINQPVKNGTFIELGAYNGLVYSNTKFFEDNLGFRGMLIEPIPKIYEDLQKNRPNCLTYNFAITSNQNKKFVDFIGTDPSSGIPDKMSKKSMEVWHSKDKKYKVKVTTLDKLITKSKIKYIDFLSIDVEGGELEVLKSINWKIPIYLICIELDENDSMRCQECRNYLKLNGFELVNRLCINEFWVNTSYFRKDELFKPLINFNRKITDYKQNFIESSCISEINENLENFVKLINK